MIAVLGVEEFSQRLDAADDQQKIVLAFEREHRIDQIVPRALLAELDFETVGEEREEIQHERILHTSCGIPESVAFRSLQDRLILPTTRAGQYSWLVNARV